MSSFTELVMTNALDQLTRVDHFTTPHRETKGFGLVNDHWSTLVGQVGHPPLRGTNNLDQAFMGGISRVLNPCPMTPKIPPPSPSTNDPGIFFSSGRKSRSLFCVADRQDHLAEGDTGSAIRFVVPAPSRDPFSSEVECPTIRPEDDARASRPGESSYQQTCSARGFQRRTGSVTKPASPSRTRTFEHVVRVRGVMAITRGASAARERSLLSDFDDGRSRMRKFDSSASHYCMRVHANDSPARAGE